MSTLEGASKCFGEVNKTKISSVKMENLLNDIQKYEKSNLKNDGILNFAVNQEKLVDNIFKKLLLSNSISKEIKRFLNQLGPGQV